MCGLLRQDFIRHSKEKAIIIFRGTIRILQHIIVNMAFGKERRGWGYQYLLQQKPFFCAYQIRKNLVPLA